MSASSTGRSLNRRIARVVMIASIASTSVTVLRSPRPSRQTRNSRNVAACGCRSCSVSGSIGRLQSDLELAVTADRLGLSPAVGARDGQGRLAGDGSIIAGRTRSDRARARTAGRHGAIAGADRDRTADGRRQPAVRCTSRSGRRATTVAPVARHVTVRAPTNASSSHRVRRAARCSRATASTASVSSQPPSPPPTITVAAFGPRAVEVAAGADRMVLNMVTVAAARRLAAQPSQHRGVAVRGDRSDRGGTALAHAWLRRLPRCARLRRDVRRRRLRRARRVRPHATEPEGPVRHGSPTTCSTTWRWSVTKRRYVDASPSTTRPESSEVCLVPPAPELPSGIATLEALAGD